MADAIMMRGVTKTFGPKLAVNNIDLTVEQGKLYGFIGPNGAGKTTTIRMIMSIIFPDRGEISVLGKASAIESKDRIGYLPEERGVYKKMRVGPFLKYMARLKGIDSAGLEGKVRAWLERMSLNDCYRKKCEELSKGMQQKVQFIAAIIHEPDLIILDEPFSGLDPVNSRLLRDLIDEQHKAGKTLIFSTHQMSQAEALCDRVIMIHQGRKVLDNSPAELAAQHDPRRIRLEPIHFDRTDLASVQAINGVESVIPPEDGDRFFEVSAHENVRTSDLIPRLASAVPVRSIEVVRPTLEDIFIQIVTGSNANQEQVAGLRDSLRARGGDGSGD
jgi:ABC-2 type transport system ATP-binding protein